MRLFLFAGLTALVLLPGRVAIGAQLSGQAGLTLYDYQSQTQDTIGSSNTTASNHLISTQLLSLNLHDIGTSALSFHAFLRNTSSLAPSDSTGNFLRLYGGYLDYRPSGAPYSLRAGRQFMIVGIANGAMDGLKAGYDLGRRVSLTGFAGLESHYDSLKISSWKRGGMVGGEASFRLPRETFLSLSGWQLNRDSVVAKRRAGGDLYTGCLPRTDLAAHVEADLIANRLYRFSIRAENKSLPRLAVNACLQYRQPIFSQGSIFNTFKISANQEAGAGLRLKAWRSLDLSGEAVREFFDGDQADRLTFTVMSGQSSVTYVRRDGWSGRSWGLTLTGDHSFRERVEFGSTLNYTRYEEREYPSARDYTLTAIARLGIRVYQGFSLTADLEDLVNPNYTQNTRLLVRASYDF